MWRLRWGIVVIASITASCGLYFLIQGITPMVRERLVLRGSDRLFECLAFSPDSKLVAAGQQDGTIKVWETSTGAEWFTLPGQSVPVYKFGPSIFSIAFSPDGKLLAWGSGDRALSILDLGSKQVTKTPAEHESRIVGLGFISNSKALVTGTEQGVVRIWDLAAKKSRVIFEASSPPGARGPRVLSLAIDASGTHLATGIFQKFLLLETKGGTPRELAKEYPVNVKPLAFHPDGKRIVGTAGKVTVWGIDGEELSTLPFQSPGAVFTMGFSPDGKLLAIGFQGAVHFTSYVHIWDFEKQQELFRFPCHEEPLSQVAWSPDGKTLGTCSYDKTVKLWDIAAMLNKMSK